jgi:flavin-binding protein dodecin
VPRTMNATDSTLDRRAKSFALLRPLYDLDANKGRHTELQLDQLDLFRIASVVLETIITEMGGSRQGALRHQIGAAVAQEIEKSAPATPAETRHNITEFVLDHLTNEKARDSFRIPYQRATEDGKVEWATAVFKLVELREIDAGSEPRYVASVEAINLFLQSLSIEIEAQQAATEAVMKHFLKNGQLDRMVEEARRAIAQTIQYQKTIEGALRMAERNVDNVDWINTMIPKLRQARRHIQERLTIEHELLQGVETRQEEAHGPDLQQLAEGAEYLRRAIEKHNQLLPVVIEANDRYLHEHSVQKFRKSCLVALPNPSSDVLAPLLRLKIAESDTHFKTDWRRMHPPSPPAIIDLKECVGRLLQKRKADELEPNEPEMPDLENVGHEKTTFSQEAEQAANEALAKLDGTLRLSEWLNAIGAGLPEARLLALLRAAHWFDGSEEGIEVNCDGQALKEADAYGDDLVIHRNGK